MFCFRDSLVEADGYKLAWSTVVCTGTSLEMTKYGFNKFCYYYYYYYFLHMKQKSVNLLISKF